MSTARPKAIIVADSEGSTAAPSPASRTAATPVTAAAAAT